MLVVGVQLDEADDERHDEQHVRQRGRVAELAVAERLGVDAVHDGFSGAGRAAGGQDEDLIEDLEGADEAEDDHVVEGRAEGRQRDVAELLPCAGAVERGGFVQFGGDALQAGEVGYFTASIKNVKDTRVGDTITGAEDPADQPLPGYRPAQSMVYCGIYTEDGSKYPDLRDALEKLQLNDASLTFEPESSVALGFGFRCGFLGMLHMEIIQERLEREFNLDLVTTLPSVIYHVYKSDGTMVKVDNPHNYPDPGTIEHAEEPYVKVSIIAPNEFVGNIMPMCQERRGEFKDMQYLDTHLVELHYQMPLNEIIYDFFDTLKANTKGYASLDYELSGYRTSDLVKVDLLLNGDGVDALSFIAHRDKAYPRARRLCEKLKENIPRQLFEVPIQAAIGGRIIARETVKAMRKDVLAKCYGGDITRKKKLLEKQKEGKKKMRNLGTVQVPTEAFMAVLKLDSD